MIGEYNGVLKIPNKEIPYFISLNQARFNVSWRDLQRLYKVKGITNRVYAIERIKNEFWFGSADGLYYYENDSVTLSQIPELENSWVTHIINQNDTVWIGTQTDGVFQVVNKKVINVFNEEQDSLSNRLVSNNCKSLVVEPNGIIWIGTNNGINKINTNTGANDLINNLDGLLSSDINALAINDESVFVATSEGLTSFDKNIQTKNKVPPPIYLSKFQIFDKDTILSLTKLHGT
jgi:ligand-binding sensor domain-containing protein